MTEKTVPKTKNNPDNVVQFETKEERQKRKENESFERAKRRVLRAAKELDW